MLCEKCEAERRERLDAENSAKLARYFEAHPGLHERLRRPVMYLYEQPTLSGDDVDIFETIEPEKGVWGTFMWAGSAPTIMRREPRAIAA